MTTNDLIVDFTPNTMSSDLIVDFAHRRSSYIGSKDIKKSVQFSPLAEVRFYERPDESIPSERYFTKDDYKKFKRANLRNLKQAHLSHISKLSKDEEEDECILTGFKNMLTPNLVRQTLQRKKDVKKAVLDEQKYQKELGEVDPEMIAHISRYFSRSGVKQAVRFGAVQVDKPNCKRVTQAAPSA